MYSQKLADQGGVGSALNGLRDDYHPLLNEKRVRNDLRHVVARNFGIRDFQHDPKLSTHNPEMTEEKSRLQL